MNSVSKAAQKVFDAAIEAMGTGDHVKVETSGGTYMALVVERVGSVMWSNDSTHTSMPLFSFAHYGEQNGDAMRDPDVVMMRANGFLFPVSFRNDYMGRNDEVLVYDEDGKINGFRAGAQADITAFCNVWATNLRHQQGLGKKAKKADKIQIVAVASETFDN